MQKLAPLLVEELYQVELIARNKTKRQPLTWQNLYYGCSTRLDMKPEWFDMSRNRPICDP